MRRLTFVLAATLWLSLAVACSQAPASITSLSPSDVAAHRSAGTGPVLIDVRSRAEYEAGHIPGALNIPYEEVAERIGEVNAPDGVALYCMKGPRARKGEAALLEAGYGPIFHVEGGLLAWRAAGYDVEVPH